MDNSGFLGSFLSKSLKTNQLEVNTDEKTLRSIARLKEPRDLFALPKDKDHDCPQQAPRWPIECQVIDERMIHIQNAPSQPEPYNQPTGSELKPRTVGEENGVVVFNYNPISAVNYEKPLKCKAAGDDSSDSDSSSDSSPEVSTPDRRKIQMKTRFVKMLDILQHSSSNSEDENEDDDDNTNSNTNTNNINTNTNSNTNNSNSNNNDENGHGEGNILNNESKKEMESIWSQQIIKKPELKAPKPMLYTPVRTNFAPKIERLEGGANQILSRKRSSSSEGSSSSGSSDNENDIDTSWPIYGNIQKKTQTGLDPEFSSQIKIKSKQERIIETQIELKKLKALTMSFQNPNQNESQVRSRNQKQKDVNDEEFAKLDSKFNAIHGEIAQVEQSFSSVSPFEPQFSRSAVGGSKFLSNCHPHAEDYDGLEFESRFESGNLAKAVMITPTYYELYLRPDLYTSRSKQWFYFRVRRTKKNQIYRFSIVNLVKSDSLYNEGMRPLMYSTIDAKEQNEGWRRCGQNIVYYRNDEEPGIDDEDDNASYSLTWNIEFQHDNDTVFFAHSYPYTYSDLQDYLMEIQKHPVKSKFCKLRLLCRSLAGNNVYYLTVTAPTNDEEAMKRKKAVVVSARVHPSETPSSWMMKGLMDFITGDTSVAKRLRHRFIFKLIPMLNPDGVIVGNTRNSLTGKDLNRQYRTVIRETYPSIWYTKAMIKRLIDECGVAMYCDMHAHSRKHNIFIYGCENRRTPDKKLTEQVFPLMMHKNVADKFSFEDCKFKIQRSKEGTGRIVVWMLGITNSYTIEASFGGSTLSSRRGTHFSTGDYEHIGRVFCETLLDYCDENPNKVKRAIKTFKLLKKIRKRERRERKAIKMKKLAEQERLRLKIIERLLKEGSSAEEPLNIPLSDYSSDEGDTSSSSDNEGKASFTHSDLEGPCCTSLKAPPCSPEVTAEVRKFYQKRMRKVMQELDRIYFQPLFKKKFRALIKSKRLKIKSFKKNPSTGTVSKKPSKNQETEATPSVDMYMNSSECDKSAAELRSEFEHSVLNSAEGTRIASGLNKVVKVPNVKKKKSVDDYEGGMYMLENKPSRKMRVSRKLRLWLEKRQIIIFRKLKKNKSKTRNRVSTSKSKPLRLAFDMPTTDPGSDLVFSTDDEYCTENSDPPQLPQNEGYETLPRARRLLQSDLQRRYIEELGSEYKIGRKQMPPELIITSPTKQNTKTKPLSYAFPFKSMQSPLPRTAPPAQLTTEFPIIGTPTTKRTSSWNNLHSSGKSASKSKSTNPYLPMSDNTNRDDLQFRLSLKKKIWAGLQPEGTTDLTRNRPLSWGMPPVTMQTKREKTTSHLTKKDDKEALFTACSQKLIAWQQQSIVPATSNSNIASNKMKGKLAPTIQTGEIVEEMTSLGVLRQITYSKSAQKTICKTDLTTTDSKAKKRKNVMSKITDTTQLIARLSKTKSSASINGTFGAGQRRLKSDTPSVTSLQANRKLSSQSNKFKTGGLVATATAQPKKNRKFRLSSNDLDRKSSGQLNNTQGPKLPSSGFGGKERTLGVITIDMQEPATDLPTRKIKTKLRRKSKPQITPAGGPTSATVSLTTSIKKTNFQ